MDKGWAGTGDGCRSGFVGRMEIRESPTGRREWPASVKGRIVRESLEPGATVKGVALRHGIAPQQLTTWRRAARQGRLALPADARDAAGLGFAALVVTDEPAAWPAPAAAAVSSAPVEIVAGGVVVRLAGATPADRIAAIAAALGSVR